MKFKSEIIERLFLSRNLPNCNSVSSSLLKDAEFENDVTLSQSVHKILSFIENLLSTTHSHNSQCSGSGSSNSSRHPTIVKDGKCYLEIADLLRESYVWENLNVGHWKSVSLGWRRAHYFLSFLKVILMLYLEERPLEECIHECDMGILMGEPVLDKVLHKISQELSQALINQRMDSDSESPDNVQSYQEPSDFELRLQSNSRFEIICLDNPPLEYFMTKHMNKCEPLLITGSIEHWPARQKWDINYVKKVAGFRTVPVEIGSKYTSEDWTQKLMTIDEFVEKYMTMKDVKQVGYVAQHRLFEQIPELGNDIRIPDFCSLGKTDDVEINAWFGPRSTVSPTHYDAKHNILVQIFGTKIIRLYPPTESKYLQPYPDSSILFNTSQLDLETINFEEFPELKNAKYCEFLLKPGSAIYIPPKWWHFVKSLSPCFSVSYWFE